VSVDPRRRQALDALLAVHAGRSLDGALSRLRRQLDDPRAAATAEEMVRGALQWQARYDHLVRHFSRRPGALDPIVRSVLHLALHQLLTSRGVPAYAAVHQAGELARSRQRARAVGYVNAVLQSVQRLVEKQPDTAADPLAAVHPLFTDLAPPRADYLATWWSHPGWLVERWCARFGDEATERLLRHANVPAPITLHVLPGHDPGHARALLDAAGAASEPVVGFARALQLTDRHDRGVLRRLLAEVPGLIVQDAGAQAVVDWLTREGQDLATADRPVIDLCAAPGGKAVHLRALVPAAAPVVAMDRHRRRLERVREHRERLALDGLPLLAGDGTQPPLQPGRAAAVLLDGPCSGTGVGRHHPEGRWRLRPATLERNGARLQALATAAADLLAPGGRLYYATCSLEPEENEAVITELLARRPDLLPDPDPDGRHERSWWPWETGTDGFFAARLRRRTDGQAGGS
jgi:16S rRNA (cytosine967-C5)-methyltransferase